MPRRPAPPFALTLDAVQPVAAEFPKGPIEVQLAGLGAFDHRRKVAAGATREMLARFG